jgi:hypothetical protein
MAEAAVVEMVKVELPVPVTCAGAKEQSDFDGKPEHANVTVPLKPLTAWRLTVYEAAVPAFTVSLAGVALSVKSATSSVTVVV